MELAIITSIAILIVWLTFRKYIHAKRIVIYNQLDSIYGKMELYIAETGMKLDEAHIRYFKAYKNLIVNPELADIHILLMMENLVPSKNMYKIRAEFHEVKNGLPSDLVVLSDKFDINIRSLINLSMLKPYFIYSLVKIVLGTIINHGISSIPRYYNRFSDILKNEIIIVPRAINAPLGAVA